MKRKEEGRKREKRKKKKSAFRLRLRCGYGPVSKVPLAQHSPTDHPDTEQNERDHACAARVLVTNFCTCSKADTRLQLLPPERETHTRTSF